MIFTSSITYPDDVKPVVEKVEKQNLGQQVVLVKQWSLPTFKYEISVEISRSRPLNIVEEFIIKIALSSIKEVIDQQFISNLLGLDQVFVDKYTTDLANKKVVDREQLPNIVITQIGKDYFNEGLVPADLTYEKIDVYFDPLFKSFYHKSSGVNKLATLKEAKMMELSKSGLREEINGYLDKLVVNNLSRKSGVVFERDELGQKIVGISVPEHFTEHGHVNFIEIWIYDIVEDKLFCRVWDEIQEIYRDDIENYITEKSPLTKDDLRISQDILKIYSDAGTTEKPKKYETIIKENLALLRNNKITGMKKNDGTVRLLRGPEINSEFLNLFNKVTQRLIIFSPWITEKVVDIDLINRFKELAKKGVYVFIGWGISRKEEYEEKQPSGELIRSLNSIKDANGFPTVFISWLGNRHEKEIVVDYSIHLMGSFNWLSYRGNYLPRGESVYLVTHREMVQEAAEHWQEAFTEAYLKKVQKSKGFSTSQFIWDLCALLSVGNNKIDVILDDLLDELIRQKKVDVVFNIFLLFFYKKQFDDSFMKCFEFLLNESNFIQSINSILHRVYKTERVVFNTIIQNYSKTLMSLKVINQKGKLIKKTETSLKFNFTE